MRLLGRSRGEGSGGGAEVGGRRFRRGKLASEATPGRRGGRAGGGGPERRAPAAAARGAAGGGRAGRRGGGLGAGASVSAEWVSNLVDEEGRSNPLIPLPSTPPPSPLLSSTQSQKGGVFSFNFFACPFPVFLELL